MITTYGNNIQKHTYAKSQRTKILFEIIRNDGEVWMRARTQMQLAVGGTLQRPRLTVSAVIVSAIAVTTLLLLRLLPTTTTTIAAQWTGRGGEGRRRVGRVQHLRHG